MKMRATENVTAKQEQAQTKQQVNTPPNGGQVPVATPMPMVGAPDSVMAQHPDMPLTQVYAPQISLAAFLLLTLLGMIIFRVLAERRRLAKKCPFCGMGLERWADECGMCKKSIFVYPDAPPHSHAK
jgi:hypothetical protein